MKAYWLETTNGNCQYIWKEFAPKKLILTAYKAPDSCWVVTGVGIHKELELEKPFVHVQKKHLRAAHDSKIVKITKDDVFVELL